MAKTRTQSGQHVIGQQQGQPVCQLFLRWHHLGGTADIRPLKTEHTMYYTKQHPFTTKQLPFNSVLERFFGNIDQMQGSDNLPNAHTRANILETKEGFQLELLAPGYAKDELKLNVEKDILTLSADPKQSEMPEGQRYTRREFALPSFKRSFQLPEHTDGDNIPAEHANGGLTVSIPKKVEVKAAVKEISSA